MQPSNTSGKAQPAAQWHGLSRFALILLVNVLLFLLVGVVEIPVGSVLMASVIVSILAVSLPIAALFAGASTPWGAARWAAFGAAGLIMQFGLGMLASRAPSPLLGGVLFAISQAGLIVWCLGLGGLVASAIKDKNLLLPLAAFLAIFDFWLVFVPEGPVGKIARGHQESLRKFAYAIPSPTHISHGGHAATMAYVGPADFMFLGMFFVAMFRFKMKTRETFTAIVPVLACYLLIVLLGGSLHFGPISLSAMPALIPIGATVLIVNRNEFKLTRDEAISTIVIVVLGIAIVGWRMSLWLRPSAPELPPAPLRSAVGPGRSRLPGSTAPEALR